MQRQIPLIQSGVLTIGVDASAPPPLHSDPDAPDFDGFEVDLTKAIAQRLGLSIKYKSALWSECISNLQAGKIDMICTAATITEDRKKVVDFSLPYLDIQLAIVVRKESEIRILEDLEGKIVGVRIATSAEEFLRDNVKAKQFHTFHMNTEAYKTLAAGKLDAVVDDAPIAKSFAKSDLKLAGIIPNTKAQYGLVFKKGNNKLRDAVNDVLTEIQADGTFAKFYRKWFGEDTSMMPNKRGNNG